MIKFILLLVIFLTSCTNTVYLTPAESFNTRYSVKCRNKTYANCIKEYASVKSKYEKQLDEIYVRK